MVQKVTGIRIVRTVLGVGMSAAVIVLLNLGCTLKARSNQDSRKYLLVWPNGHSGYSLSKVELPSLYDPKQIEGPHVRVMMMNPDRSSGNRLKPLEIQAQLAGDTWIVQDVTSGIGLSVYGYLERIRMWEEKYSVAQYGVWPMEVVVNIRVAVANQGILINNAYYDPKEEKMAVTPYVGSQLSQGLNLGVIGHEFFHSHFDRATKVIFGRSGEIRDYPLEVVLRAWNEGLADYFGFVLAGRRDFFSETFGDQASNARVVMKAPGAISSIDFMICKPCTPFDRACEDSRNKRALTWAYSTGTQYARRLFRLGEALGGGEAHDRLLASLLKNLKVDIQSSTQKAIRPETLWNIILARAQTESGPLDVQQIENGQSREAEGCLGVGSR